MKNKKIIVFSLVILLVVICIVFLIWNMDPICDKNGRKFTYEEIINLNNSSNYISNIYVKTGDFEQYRKNNLIKQNYYDENNNELRMTIWRDFSNENVKEITISYGNTDENIDGIFAIDTVNTTINVSPSNFSLPTLSEKYNYTFLGRKKYDDKDVIVIKISYIDSDFYGPFDKILFYIDEETGIVLKSVEKKCFPFKTYKIETTYKLNSVTDEDVKEPDYRDYSKFEYIDNTLTNY